MILYFRKCLMRYLYVLQYLDGGSALHLNLEQKLTQEGFYKLINVAAKAGCNYWCTNVKVTIC
ncbi:MAG: hypothetical protein E6R13_06645, partial [Spirochaetes bacterium]